jgi:hypothetical protein
VRAWLSALLLAAAGTALAAPPSGTLLFEATAAAHWDESPDCWGGLAKRRPSARQRTGLVRGILAGCDRWYPGDAAAPYRFLALLLTESNGSPVRVETAREKSYGPFCASVAEARETARLFALGCPRATWQVIDRLLQDPEWAALVAVGTIWRYDLAQGRDQVRGLVMYKAGGAGLDRIEQRLAKERLPMTSSEIWTGFIARLAWVQCLRDRSHAGGVYVRCGCMPPRER